MKKLNYIKTILLGLAATASLSSCLKDKTYVDFSQGGVSAELPLSGLNSFGTDAVLSDTAIISFGVNIASSKTPTTDSKITVAVDPTKLTDYMKTNTKIPYEIMPASVYTFKTTVVDIPAGQRLKILTFTIYKNKLDPTKSYMLPIAITSAPGLNISANNATHYYHVIGNDFAGAYHHQFIRTPAGGDFPDKVDNFIPVSTTQFTALSGYLYPGYHYSISFTKTGTGASATYTDFAIFLADVDAKYLTDNSITVTAPPTFIDPNFKSTNVYTYTQALALFSQGFTMGVLNSTPAARLIVDKFNK